MTFFSTYLTFCTFELHVHAMPCRALAGRDFFNVTFQETVQLPLLTLFVSALCSFLTFILHRLRILDPVSRLSSLSGFTFGTHSLANSYCRNTNLSVTEIVGKLTKKPQNKRFKPTLLRSQKAGSGLNAISFRHRYLFDDKVIFKLNLRRCTSRKATIINRSQQEPYLEKLGAG